MMCIMRFAAATILAVLVAGCAGTTATPSATPLATSTVTASGAPTSSPGVGAPSGTQAAAAALDCTAPATPIVNLTEGPYYTANPPQNANLRTAGVVGTPLTLTGYVVSRSCQPIANAKLDFWQADGNGDYDNSGYRLRGWQMTDANGAYRLETVIPGLYPGRTEHIHFKVTAGGQTYVSQLFFPGVSQNASDSIYSDRMLIKLNTATSPATGTYTFVVNVA
jgi:protocatechuate 3,4-dioxygenase beta subunit